MTDPINYLIAFWILIAVAALYAIHKAMEVDAKQEAEHERNQELAAKYRGNLEKAALNAQRAED